MGGVKEVFEMKKKKKMKNQEEMMEEKIRSGRNRMN